MAPQIEEDMLRFVVAEVRALFEPVAAFAGSELQYDRQSSLRMVMMLRGHRWDAQNLDASRHRVARACGLDSPRYFITGYLTPCHAALLRSVQRLHAGRLVHATRKLDTIAIGAIVAYGFYSMIIATGYRAVPAEDPVIEPPSAPALSRTPRKPPRPAEVMRPREPDA